MWAGQRADSPPDLGDEVGHCASEILQLATGTIIPSHLPTSPSTLGFNTASNDRLERRFVGFPLFLAGFASNSHQHTSGGLPSNVGSSFHDPGAISQMGSLSAGGISGGNGGGSGSNTAGGGVPPVAPTMPGVIGSNSGGSGGAVGNKQRALELLSSLQRRCLGSNTGIMRDVLRAVYERQKAMVLTTGHDLTVDWRDMLRERGLHVVNFGL